ncbi:EamA family transporter RarD [Mesorhizobium sp. RP14(2022)]|uniref:EamA family transporter RarD n=1 Tax=Mesorhizobium liriopis TaxID=2953882 RepID=A0ABT1C7Q3_9HYPH|nr:EamA family transporter RarD [Mesorhizobium liriopis]MCO6050698.1 EamA family transporter RarD [Mesorhizobium liriopis]
MSTLAAAPVDAPADESRKGFAFAFSAYLLWGFLPFYLKAVGHIPIFEVVAHRILWSLPIAGLVVILTGRTKELREALISPRMIGMGMLMAGFLTVNWSIYVWAIGSGHAVEGALGYYINPLISVLLAAAVLGEKLNGLQMVAVGIAAAAVALLTWETGGLPWVSLGLAGSWGVYALLKKALPIGANQGFFLEVLLLSPLALICLFWVGQSGTAHFGVTGWQDTVLLMASGLVTAIPLILYANGAKRLRLSTIAIMQYIAPTLVFLIAVFVFREPFSTVRGIAFILIWLSLVVYTWSIFRKR